MKSSYVYSSKNIANSINDLVLILTGETDPNNLSASCDTTNTTIVNTTPAGWTLHDNNVDGNGTQVIKAPYSDDANEYKYVELRYDSNYIRFMTHETWDNIAHTGTNETPYGQTILQIYIDTNGGTITLFSSGQFIIIKGSGVSNSGLYFLGEYSRIQPWNTSSNYPSFACFDSGDALYHNSPDKVYPIRGKKIDGTDVVGYDARSYLTTIGIKEGSSDWQNSTNYSKVHDNEGGLHVPSLPIYITNTSVYSALLGEFSVICDVWAAPRDSLTDNEIVTRYGTSDEYIAVRAYEYSSLVIHFLIPNG